MAEWRSCADEILAVDLAQGHAFAGSRRQGQIALAHRTRLRGAERRTRISSLRRSRLAWLSPPRDTLHRSLRLSDLRTGGDSPLSLLAAQDASVTQRFSTPQLRRSDPNVTSKTRSRRSENISPSRSQKPLCDVHAVKQCTARQLSISIHDAVELGGGVGMSLANIMSRLAATATIVLSANAAAWAQEKQSTEDLAKAAQNPIADLASLPLQNNSNFNTGPYSETQNIL